MEKGLKKENPKAKSMTQKAALKKRRSEFNHMKDIDEDTESEEDVEHNC